MDATSTSNIFILIIVLIVLSVLVTDNDTLPAPVNKKSAFNTLVTQKNFKQCRNSLNSKALCIKLADDLSQGVITNDEYLN